MTLTVPSSHFQTGRCSEGHFTSEALHFVGRSMLLRVVLISLLQQASALPLSEQTTTYAPTDVAGHATTSTAATETTIAAQTESNTTETEITPLPSQAAKPPACEDPWVAQYWLWKAVRADDGPGVERAVGCGADVEKLDLYGMTPLTLAAKHCREDALRSLLRLGAYVERRDGWRGISPLQWAAHYGGDRCVNILLLEGGARPGGVTREEAREMLWRGIEENSELLIERAVHSGANLEELHWKVLPLLSATRSGHLGAVRALLRLGANTEGTDNPIAETALFVASEDGNVAIVRELLAAGANVNAETNVGYSPLLIACSRGHEAVVDELLAAGASLRSEYRIGYAPILLASMKGSEGVVRKLLAAGASPRVEDRGKVTPLHYAAVRGYLSIARMLVEAGADLSHRDIRGETPLDAAINYERPALAEYLRSVEISMYY